VQTIDALLYFESKKGDLDEQEERDILRGGLRSFITQRYQHLTVDSQRNVEERRGSQTGVGWIGRSHEIQVERRVLKYNKVRRMEFF
jgi:hypothetical protein